MSAAPRGLIERLAEGWRDPRGSMRRLLDERPSEATVFSLLMLAGFIGFVGRSFLVFGRQAAAPVAPELLRAELAAGLVGALFFGPLAAYGAAAAAKALGGLAGGRGDWRACRTACVWGLMLSAPALAAAHGVWGLSIGRGWTSTAPAALVLCVAALYAGYLWAACVATAHGFRSSWGVFGAVAALAAVGAGLGALLGALLGAWIG